MRSPVKHTIQSQGERDMKQLLKPFAETVIVEPSGLVFSNRVNKFGGTSSRYGYKGTLGLKIIPKIESGKCE